MLSISPMSGAGQGDYYLNLAQEDYYTKGVEPPGRWHGKGAEALLLSGDVTAEALRQVLNGYAPYANEPLVQNAGKENRQSGWDLTFSAPKSVSVAWSQADDPLRTAIEAAHDKAVSSALTYLEREAGITRRGQGGYEKESANVVFAVFQHGTSRAQDPALHSHALLLNVGLRSDGTTGTLESKNIYQHKMVAGALYRAELSYQLERQLGFVSERKGSWFELKGVSAELIGEFSSRRKEIEAHLAERGFEGAKAAKVATLATRNAKESIPRAELFHSWREVGHTHQWSTEEVKALCKGPQPERDTTKQQERAFSQTVESLSQHQSHFSKREIIRGVAEAAQGGGFGLQAVLQSVEQRLSNDLGIVHLGVVGGEVRYTTREILELEKKMLGQVEASRSAFFRPVSGGTITQTFLSRPGMNEEQQGAVRHITQDGKGISVVSGMAGTGKSYMLSAVKEAFESEGKQVIGAALSGKAAQGLQDGSGIDSETIHRLLAELERGERRLTPNTVVVIDEAGMVGTRQMERLVHYTQDSGAKLVLVGDARQLQPVEAGGPFKAISGILGEAQLTTIQRQQESWMREAIHHFADGDARKGLAAFAERGQLAVADTREGAISSLMGDWKKEGITKPEENIILAGTNSEALVLNQEAQRIRYWAGVFKGESLRDGSTFFFSGDRILFTRNSRLHGVRNGNLGTIERIEPTTKTIHARLDDGKSVCFSLNDYGHVRLGYAVTTHKSQGMTAKNAYILAGGSMQDRELSYVQVSRAKETTRIYTDKIEAGDQVQELARRMSVSRQKELATTLAPEVRVPKMELRWGR